jgi:CDP-glucose 4,6-dehydratase
VHFFVTGHTGFKGAWLTLLLHSRGHEVSGLSLDPLPGSLFERARVEELLAVDVRADVRDAEAVRTAVTTAAPDVLLHLAAQPLVRESYRDPRFTVETNVMGTWNVLEAVQATGGVQASVVVTTDKVYRNVGQRHGYREPDALGGKDPYSASKAAADLLTQSWIASTPSGVPTAIARAGNVVGGGDVSPERLMVDLLASFAAGTPAVLRAPDAVRPWQHVLDCLEGYLVLVDALLAGQAHGEAFNFGPPPESCVPVGEVASRAAALWGPAASWRVGVADPGLPEATLLTLDPGQADRELGWRSRLDLDATLRLTVDWAREVAAGADPREVSLRQVASGPGPVRS